MNPSENISGWCKMTVNDCLSELNYCLEKLAIMDSEDDARVAEWMKAYVDDNVCVQYYNIRTLKNNIL